MLYAIPKLKSHCYANNFALFQSVYYEELQNVTKLYGLLDVYN